MKLRDVRDFLVEISEGTAVTKFERESRPVLAAINLRIQENVLEGVSTDSYILIHRSIPVDGVPDMGWTMFNAERIKKALRWFPKTENADIDITASGLSISSSMVTVTIPPTEGEFPNFQKLFPTGDPVSLTNVAVNGEFAVRIQKAFRGENLLITFYGEGQPLLVRPVSPLLGHSAKDQWAIWMPIRMPR